jgi:hypothetical protein
MKNIRKFETTAAMDAATLEDVSINYNVETGNVLSMPLKPNVKNYMRFVAVEDSQINLTSRYMTTGEADTSVDLKHSKDGVTWTQYDFNPIPLAAGETLYLKGNNENGFSGVNEETGEARVCTFGDIMHDGGTSGKFECRGNIMSLLYGDDFEDKTTIPSAGCFMYTLALTPITTAPELPATTLAKYCYQHVFEGCTSLTTAPELHATTLAQLCYNYMFSGCSNMTTVPELPATTLADACYENMFNGCTSLTKAPELPATTLAYGCYFRMFNGCNNLNHITMLATDISATDCLTNWVGGVSSIGTFVKHPDMTSLPTGASGIPYGWTVEDAVL